MTSLLNITALKGDLETGTAHSKPHAVHVDVVGQGVLLRTRVVGKGGFGEGGGGADVFEYWSEGWREGEKRGGDRM